MSSLFLATSAPNLPLKLYHSQRDPFKMCQSISQLCLILRGGLHFIQNKSRSPCTSAVSRGPLNSSCHLSRSLISTHTGFSIQKKKKCQDFCCIRIFAPAVHSAPNDLPSNIHSPHYFTSFKFCLNIIFTIETCLYIIYCCYLPYPVEHLPPINIQFNLLIHYVYYLFPSLECKFLEGKDLWFIHWYISRTTVLALKELLLNSFIKWGFLAFTWERQGLQLKQEPAHLTSVQNWLQCC